LSRVAASSKSTFFTFDVITLSFRLVKKLIIYGVAELELDDELLLNEELELELLLLDRDDELLLDELERELDELLLREEEELLDDELELDEELELYEEELLEDSKNSSSDGGASNRIVVADIGIPIHCSPALVAGLTCVSSPAIMESQTGFLLPIVQFQLELVTVPLILSRISSSVDPEVRARPRHTSPLSPVALYHLPSVWQYKVSY